ncbi:Der1-like family-domain-containing protein [Lipomyces oligophaga]|uniref:Der1-like family-domain-containing protein n=1 Tax=Lipomyces oligophaga TaxID=45792 RepID=UPI0034CFD34B
MANDLSDFLRTVPPVTRVLLLGTLGTTFGALLNIIPPLLIVNYWPLTLFKLQLWRPITAFFVVMGGDPMSKLMEIYMLYTYGKDLELEKFKGYTADYVYYVLLIGSGIAGLNALTGGVAYVAPLLVAFAYTWSQHTPDRIVSFYFGIMFKAKYLPVFILSFKLLIEGQRSFLISLTGFGAAYCYQSLENARGQGRPSPWLQTPQFLKNMIPGAWSASTGLTTDPRNVHRSFGSAYYPGTSSVNGSARPGTGRSSGANPSAATSNTTFRWGRGHRLGD